MSGDCGHGWGYHSQGAAGPCDKCEAERRAQEQPAQDDAALIANLHRLHDARKPWSSGASGQIVGMEMYRIVANGAALEAIPEAAARLSALCDQVAEQPKLRALLKEANSIANDAAALMQQWHARSDAAEDRLRDQQGEIERLRALLRECGGYLAICPAHTLEDRKIALELLPRIDAAIAAAKPQGET